jgi:hypothetical protein
MTLYRPPDYLGKAKGMRAGHLGTSPAPVRTICLEDDPKRRGTHAGDPCVNPTRKHALIATQEQVAELATSLGTATLVALDLETTGLDPRGDRIRLLTLATERGAWLVDCFEVDPRPLFPVLAETTLAIHNALFDLGFLFQMGFEPGEHGGVLDTMLLSQMLEGLRPKDKEDE